MRPPPGPWWLLLWLPPLASGPVHWEEAALSGNRAPAAARVLVPALGCGLPEGARPCWRLAARGFRTGSNRTVWPSSPVYRSFGLPKVTQLVTGIPGSWLTTRLWVQCICVTENLIIAVTITLDSRWVIIPQPLTHCRDLERATLLVTCKPQLRVKITSPGLLSIVYITERHNCQYPETILSFTKCMIHNFWTPKDSNEVTIVINPYGQTVCFSVKPVRLFIYKISINRNIYVLVVGFFSFAVCYTHGPLVDDRNRSLLMWTLRVLSLVLVYAGVAVPQFAYTVMVLLLCSQSLYYPLKAFSYIRWKMKPWFTTEKLVVRYLTEDEYREQADAETTRALEELRQACRRPDFPAWLAISRLYAPKKFADFVLGGSHLSPEEISLHEEQYGLGGAFLEEQLFNLRTA
ncbi:Transmembrane protein 194B [Tupaia chinensis]|uniref:Transmembrane protein 194B n=1 Tax=Tupaia chinensis TaxID=246437 RepID=L9KV75_TUPCH|nr:Transmembrane protein 194B [Tupaia chinensis]